jgi:hypothetical protein
MYSEELISHPELQSLIKKFPKVDVKMNMIYLGWFGYSGMGQDVYAVKVIFRNFSKRINISRFGELTGYLMLVIRLLIGVTEKLFISNTKGNFILKISMIKKNMLQFHLN